MFIRNLLSNIFSGWDAGGAPPSEKSSTKEKSPNNSLPREPRDTLELSEESRNGQGRKALPTQFEKGQIYALRAAYGRKEAPQAEQAPAASPAYRSGFVKDYMDARQIDNRVMELARKYPDLVKVTTRPYGTSGYDGKLDSLKGSAPLRYLTISSGKGDNANKPGALFLASPHGGERMNPLAMLELAEQLCANYKPGSDDPKSKEITSLLDSMNIYIAPVTNPDGLNYATYDDATQEWRKTRAPNGETDPKCKGVDINRNYDYKWSPYPEGVTPGTEDFKRFNEMYPKRSMYEGYSGPHPLSEPESRHVAGIIDEHPDIKFACDFHSSGEVVKIPKGIKNGGELEAFKSLQKSMIDGIGKPQGKSYDPVVSDNYQGTLKDYLYNKKGIYALLVEAGKTSDPQTPAALRVVDGLTSGAIEFLRAAREIWQREAARRPGKAA